jgi:23S rRNA (uracil1939-C5)-methyltransferase
MTSASSKKGKLTRGHAVRWGSGGDALVRLDDGTEAWGRGLVPGDVGTFVARREGARTFVSLVALETASEHRVEPACAHAERCGGCPWMAAAPALATDAKRDAVSRAVDARVPVEWAPAESAVGYRRRARLAFDHARTGLRLGYRGARSNDVIDIASCAVLEPALAAALPQLRAALEHAKGKGELRFTLGVGGGAIAAVRAESAQPPALYDALRALVDAGTLVGASLAIAEPGSREPSRPAVFGDAVERTPTADGEPLLGTLDGFSQANDRVALAMARTVAEWAEPAGARVLELYAGHGNLTVGLARDAAQLTAVEQSAEASRALRANLAARGLAGHVITGDASTAPTQSVDVVVLDPPRTGALDALPVVLAARPERIVMASCDPRTLERDVRRLTASGYTLRAARAFDMFPGTPHVEAVVRLDRTPPITDLAGNSPRR